MRTSQLGRWWWTGVTWAVCGAGCQQIPSAEPVTPPQTVVLIAPPGDDSLPQAAFVPSNTAGPALSLTAADGTGLRLVELSVRAVLDDPLAFTELRLVFDNPEARTLEGTFRITLPPGASISRFAMRLDDGWQEGEVVEKQAAREAYEDFLHRKQDPALLEQAAGNEFSARVFPILAHGRKELIISFSNELEGNQRYLLPLGGLPNVDLVDVEVYAEGRSTPLASIKEKNFAPKGDYAIKRARRGRAHGLKSGELVVARVAAPVDTRPDPLDDVMLLVDTSASRALGFDAQIALVERITQGIIASGGASTKLFVACFDQEIEPVYEGPAGGFGAAGLAKIKARGALGASDLVAALRWAGERAKGSRLKRLVLVSDGVATAGEDEAFTIGKEAMALKDAGLERLDAVAVGGIRDSTTLKRLTVSGLARDGVVIDSAVDASALAQKLTRRTRSGIPVEVKGARFWYPQVLDGVQAGDEALVYAELPNGGPLEIKVGEKSVSPVLREVERPLVERAFAKAKIASLLEEKSLGADKAKIKEQVIALSTRHRVLSPFTSLLVLETEADYERFRIDRSALVDILTVDGGRVATNGRSRASSPLEVASEKSKAEDAPRALSTSTAAPPSTVAPPPPVGSPPPAAKAMAQNSEISDAFGAGGLGLSGSGAGGGGRSDGIGLGSVGTLGHGAGTGDGQGFGSGHGRLGGSHRAQLPQVRMGATTVSGRIPPEVIRRIVRMNFGRFRGCYQNGLLRNPQLQGRVAVRFIIDSQGQVSTATNGDSDLPDSNVVNCVVNAFKGLTFPAPEAGIITVVYPIHFSPSSDQTPSSRQPVPVQPGEEREEPATATPYMGRFKQIHDLLESSNPSEGISSALRWVAEAPGDIMALTALGDAYQKAGKLTSAARAYGSLIDLFPARADLRRYTGARLEALHGAAQKLAIDTLAKARKERPDHPSSHRLYAMALLRNGEYERAFEVLAEAYKRSYPVGRFAGVKQILSEDMGLCAAAWARAEPKKKDEIARRLREAGGTPESGPSLRFVLNWETDANDVDFHIYDDKGGHAYFSKPKLESGGELYADVTTGYGPECFTVRKARELRSKRYTLQAHYYSRGPMGYGMGKLEVIEHDGKGGLSFGERPFVVMTDRAYVNLGEVGSDGREVAPKKR